MKTRRSFLTAALAAGAMAVASVGAQAADWQSKYKTVNFGVITAENEADRIVRYKPVVAYLEKELGVNVEFRVATDYAGIIEGMKAGKIEVASFGPASYAQAWIVTKGKVEPILGTMDLNGNTGYYSVLVVQSDSPYQNIDDLKGKRLAFADPNSTSGHQAPRYFMTEAGIDADTYFKETAFSGSHENSVIALLNGTFDVAATWYNNDDRSNFSRMWDKGMIPKDSVRVIWKSPKLPSSPVAVHADLPADMKAAVKKAFFEMKDRDAAAWKGLTDGKSLGYQEMTHADFEPIVRMIQSNLRNRRGS